MTRKPHHLRRSLLAATLAAVPGLAPAVASDCEDMLEVPLHWPHYTVAHVKVQPSAIPGRDADCDGFPDEIAGSGVMIDHCIVLTCAHNLFNRRSRLLRCTSPGTDFGFLMNDPSHVSVAPAAFLRFDGRMLAPFGAFQADLVGVDERYMRPGNLRHMRRDIGFIRLAEPVEAIRTFMGLQVGGLDHRASDLHVAGYSSAFNIGSDTFSNLHKGIAPSPWGDAGFHNYGVDTHSGISGGPQWDSRTNRIVGVHAYDMGPLCAGGPRFGGGNIAIAEEIFAMSCADASGDGGRPDPMPWPQLLQTTLAFPEILVPEAELRVVDGMEDWPHPPARCVRQVIENTVYQWCEYDLIDPFGQEPLQMVRMIAPEPGWLDATAAQALLSASRNWGAVFGGLPPMEAWSPYEAGAAIEFEESLEAQPPLEGEDEGPAVLFVLEGGPNGGPTGDVDGDGRVNGSDLAGLLGGWGQVDPASGARLDLDGNGIVDGADLAALLSNWTD